MRFQHNNDIKNSILIHKKALISFLNAKLVCKF